MAEEGTSAAAAPSSIAQNCTFFKKPPRKLNNIRKRATQEDTQEDAEGSAVVQKTKVRKDAVLGGKTQKSSTSVAAATARAAEEKKKVSENTFYYESSGQVQMHTDSGATATLETETEFDKDARALREKVLKNADDTLKRTTAGSGPEMYKGMNAYTDHKAGFRREQSIAGEKAGGAHGPLRGSAHIRMSARFDYQPDICKDYKETGYCGFGDSCKFLHDRGDYKSGWELEKDWEEAQKAKREKLALKRLSGNGEEEEESEEDEDGLPFACFICRESFVDPVVTRCKHYFCEHCALKHHSKNKKCFVCNKPTNGMFNTAHDILKKANKAKDKDRKK